MKNSRRLAVSLAAVYALASSVSVPASEAEVAPLGVAGFSKDVETASGGLVITQSESAVNLKESGSETVQAESGASQASGTVSSAAPGETAGTVEGTVVAEGTGTAESSSSGAVTAQSSASGPSGLEDIMQENLTQFVCESGVGAWESDLFVSRDGSFTGSYHDSNPGDTGDGYPNGSIVISSCIGKLTVQSQTGENSWRLTVSEFSLDHPAGYTAIQDGVNYEYEAFPGIGGKGAGFILYGPDTTPDELSAATGGDVEELYANAGYEDTSDLPEKIGFYVLISDDSSVIPYVSESGAMEPAPESESESETEAQQAESETQIIESETELPQSGESEEEESEESTQTTGGPDAGAEEAQSEG